jgi:pyruvate dehydrogenase E2 component (dihydrolipoamide acetyltransferase)
MLLFLIGAFMALEFKFPDVGEGVTEGVLLKWLVKVGDTVKTDQPLAEIETDKAVVEVPSPEDGVILSLPWKVNDIIDVGKILAVIGKKGEKYSPGAAPTAKEETDSDDESVSVVGNMTDKPITLPSPGMKKSSSSATKKINAMPRVRKLAKQLTVDLSVVSGTGHNGQITEEDVKQASSSSTVSKVSPSPEASVNFSKFGEVEEIKMSGMRKAIAQHMQKSVRIAPHAVAMEEADVTELAKVRKKEKPNAERQKAHLTYLPFIIKAVVQGLKKHPVVNSSLDEQKQSIIQKKYYNIGIAVDTENGLMVPVIKDADKKSIIEIAKEITSLAEKARTRKISLEEMSGGSFTVTNYGSIAGTFGVPIINYPEAAILGLGRIKERPEVTNSKGLLGGQGFEARKMLPLSMSFDHRIIDGAEAARFLKTVIRNLEDPSLLLVNMG